MKTKKKQKLSVKLHGSALYKQYTLDVNVSEIKDIKVALRSNTQYVKLPFASASLNETVTYYVENNILNVQCRKR